MSPPERFAAWLLTGPVGRVVAFAWDLAAAWWRWATRRLARYPPRPPGGTG